MNSDAALFARGKIVDVQGSTVVFHPVGTTYQLHLEADRAAPPAPGNRPVDVVIRVRARKLWTVPSGGLFISPIIGPPRTIQGRVRRIDPQQLVITAGVLIVVDLPASESAYDLTSGPVEVGSMVNVVAFPGATIEVPAPVGQAER